MTEKKSFYITTTLPYVNAEPHIGFAMELVRTDVVARYKELTDYDVFFNTGTDEHGQKIFDSATKAGEDVMVYADRHTERFEALLPALGISPEARFIRTTDEHHKKSAQEFWQRCDEAGDIYKKDYQVKYCVGCELAKTESELETGRCPLHPNLELELREEENYFFRFSKYQEKLLELYNRNSEFVIPNSRFNEIKSFVERGLEDFSISRLKEKMAWGVPVPSDDEHVMYVWFDALTNYISTLGWPEDEQNFRRYWADGTPTQYCGKDNLRQQSAMWQAMLMSADLPTSHQIVINGFITSGGQKMSKSLGNTINPFEVVEKYGADALRYFVCRELSTFEDSDFTWERFHEAYTANLVNGLGNLTSRIMKLAESNLSTKMSPSPDEDLTFVQHPLLGEALKNFQLQKATDHIWQEIGELDKDIQDKRPWETKDVEVIKNLVERLLHIGHSLAPFMPETSAKILNTIKENKMPAESLFPRLPAPEATGNGGQARI